MTEEQGDALAARWPDLDERIICLGETDITPPQTRHPGRRGTASRTAWRRRYAISCDELTGEDEDEDT